MIDLEIIYRLKNECNLLAFSAGVDSTALFFLLVENNISFDCAMINYHARAASAMEERYAHALCTSYGKKLHIKHIYLGNNNFEAKAREIRYAFFHELITRHNYSALLTAHQLNDWTEWFLMQFAKGAGLFELCGMQPIKEQEQYVLIRPLLTVSKKRLIAYLNDKNIFAFRDATNDDPRFLRNCFRARFAQPLVDRYESGIRESLYALLSDCARFETNEAYVIEKELFAIALSIIDYAHQADIYLKRSGALLSKHERKLLRDRKSFVAGRKFAIGFNEQYLFIAPFVKTTMSKTAKESYRTLKIPPNIRPYMFVASIAPSEFCKRLTQISI
jgi:tRNA(Ile)-lysidine synthase